MFHIAKIEIQEFKGHNRPLVLHLDRHVNFLIGRNGTGKTSLMNVINAALNANMKELFLASFKSIEVTFQKEKNRTRPILRYTKEYIEEERETGIKCSYRDKTSDQPVEVLTLQSELTASGSASWTNLRMPGNGYARRTLPANTQIVGWLEKRINQSWLSVNRAKSLSVGSETLHFLGDAENKFATSVDRKLNEVANNFAAYFSTLDKSSADATDRFQTQYFLSLISPPKTSQLKERLLEIDPESERAALTAMFTEFKLQQSDYVSKLDKFINGMNLAIPKYTTNGGIPADDFLTVTDTVRIHDLAQEWDLLLENRNKIYEPKIDFVDTVNKLFFQKKIQINAENQPDFYNNVGDKVDSENLSSGEKQLLIILGETLTQRRANWIFMADEPELSLHIDWQSKLVPSLITLNPHAQILFATHSPDIVGAYGDNVVDLEKVLFDDI